MAPATVGDQPSKMAALEKYDFVELVTYDVHGRAKGRLVSKKRMRSILKKGLSIIAAVCYRGIEDQPPREDNSLMKDNGGSLYLWPLPDTMTDVLPCSRGKHSVGQVLCTLKDNSGRLEGSTPHVVAERQLSRLEAMGYSLRSSFEIEFGLFHADTLTGFGHCLRWSDMVVVGKHEELFLDFIVELESIGVQADTFQTEHGTGQYEMTLDVEEGIKMAQATSKLKSAAEVFFSKRNLKPSFMTQDLMGASAHGFHFNHSLWTSDGQSVFLDGQDPDRLSATGRHWLAGLVTHACALTALCCPTVNCYRRLHADFVPSVTGWTKGKSNASYRLKVEGQDNVYLENRIPSSASNPYLVTAGVIAAGMDGVNRKLSLEEVDCDQELPRSLESALKALEEDDYMVEALGTDFVTLFTKTKRHFEIDLFKPFSSSTDEEKFEREKQMYFWG